MRTLNLAAILLAVVLSGFGCSSSANVSPRPSVKPAPAPVSTTVAPTDATADPSDPAVAAPNADALAPTNTGNAIAKRDLIRVTSPKPNADVSSPISIAGEARGSWFFGASFLVKLVDANGKTLGTGTAKTEGEWMTTEFVPFTLDLDYVAIMPGSGTIVLMRSNPSGDPSRADELDVPVRYAASGPDGK
ncbi:MAG: Gmad2 immunoglobulin-like domain-containing protein [Candidatus Uhrbacteria bacterium]